VENEEVGEGKFIDFFSLIKFELCPGSAISKVKKTRILYVLPV
jgi:hypothetical protein